ncbi:hypothetical protein [Polaribacter sp. SA4-10]|nr:hypothetical protein [Polaribacter sp. SA4-10]
MKKKDMPIDLILHKDRSFYPYATFHSSEQNIELITTLILFLLGL